MNLNNLKLWKDKMLRNLGLFLLKQTAVPLRGHVRVYSDDDLIFDDHNVIVNGGRSLVISALVDSVGAVRESLLGSLRLGTLGHVDGDPQTPITPTATAVALNDMNGPTVEGPTVDVDPSGTAATFTFLLDKADGNGSEGFAVYTEAGLYDSSGNLFAYETFPAAHKDSGKVLKIEWTIFT